MIARRKFSGVLLIGGMSMSSLTGCSALSALNTPAPRIFELTPKSTFPADLPQTNSSLVVDTPTASSGLNTARIAVHPLPTSIDYYADVVWVDVIPIMVQTLIVETLQNTQKVDVFNRSDLAARADFALICHIREFQAELQQQAPTPIAHVRLQFRLLRLPQRLSVASTFVDFHVPSASGAIEDIVAAHDDALGEGLKQMAIWVVTAIDANRPSRRDVSRR